MNTKQAGDRVCRMCANADRHAKRMVRARIRGMRASLRCPNGSYYSVVCVYVPYDAMLRARVRAAQESLRELRIQESIERQQQIIAAAQQSISDSQAEIAKLKAAK